MANSANDLASLVDKMSNLNTEYAKLRGAKDSQELCGPAGEDQIKAAEQACSIRLPDDYKDFLRLHNGWRNFEGSYGLLSTEELVSGGESKKKIVQIKEMQREQGDKAAEEGLIFFAGPHGVYCCYFDRSKQSANGEMPVVHWQGGEEERDKSFTAFLKEKIDVMEELVKEERAKLR